MNKPIRHPFTAVGCVEHQEYSLLIAFFLFGKGEKRETYKGVGCIGIFFAVWMTRADGAGLFDCSCIEFKFIQNKEEELLQNSFNTIRLSLENQNIEKEMHLPFCDD